MESESKLYLGTKLIFKESKKMGQNFSKQCFNLSQTLERSTGSSPQMIFIGETEEVTIETWNTENSVVWRGRWKPIFCTRNSCARFCKSSFLQWPQQSSAATILGEKNKEHKKSPQIIFIGELLSFRRGNYLTLVCGVIVCVHLPLSLSLFEQKCSNDERTNQLSICEFVADLSTELDRVN